MVAGAAFAALLFWVLLLTATTGIIHMLVGFAWYWTCLILAVIHLLAGIALLRAARTPGRPAFQHTIAEFQKDREWLQNLQNRKFKP